ncbi:hypothetical protein BD626DRAFT_479017 [Schizophyllum amplum]|uniref:Uncharacterized protein n=1 Tax=Schizophyllum amplum TaxID=97359 RepID=A0A550CRW8_9AGAR|nr:hypothetical protein BD626DRAFT_479017 [Auriculariopsis ampla]
MSPIRTHDKENHRDLKPYLILDTKVVDAVNATRQIMKKRKRPVTSSRARRECRPFFKARHVVDIKLQESQSSRDHPAQVKLRRAASIARKAAWKASLPPQWVPEDNFRWPANTIVRPLNTSPRSSLTSGSTWTKSAPFPIKTDCIAMPTSATSQRTSGRPACSKSVFKTTVDHTPPSARRSDQSSRTWRPPAAKPRATTTPACLPLLYLRR